MSVIELESEFLKNTILGKINWTRCPECNAEGRWYFNENKNEPVHITEWDEYDSDECTNCNGVGYIVRPF